MVTPGLGSEIGSPGKELITQALLGLSVPDGRCGAHTHTHTHTLIEELEDLEDERVRKG